MQPVRDATTSPSVRQRQVALSRQMIYEQGDKKLEFTIDDIKMSSQHAKSVKQEEAQMDEHEAGHDMHKELLQGHDQQRFRCQTKEEMVEWVQAIDRNMKVVKGICDTWAPLKQGYLMCSKPKERYFPFFFCFSRSKRKGKARDEDLVYRFRWVVLEEDRMTIYPKRSHAITDQKVKEKMAKKSRAVADSGAGAGGQGEDGRPSDVRSTRTESEDDWVPSVDPNAIAGSFGQHRVGGYTPPPIPQLPSLRKQNYRVQSIVAESKAAQANRVREISMVAEGVEDDYVDSEEEDGEQKRAHGLEKKQEELEHALAEIHNPLQVECVSNTGSEAKASE